MWQQIFGWFSRLISSQPSQSNSGVISGTPSSPSVLLPESSGSGSLSSEKLRWGAKVSHAFRFRLRQIAAELGTQADWLMACMAFESAETFSPSVKNGAGSGATGLIQFMPATARGMGTTVETLALMTAEQQLEYVREYFLPYRGRLNSLSSVYMAILWPKAVGWPDSALLWTSEASPITYRQNSGLDTNKDGVITVGEASGKVHAKYERGALFMA